RVLPKKGTVVPFLASTRPQSFDCGEEKAHLHSRIRKHASTRPQSFDCGERSPRSPPRSSASRFNEAAVLRLRRAPPHPHTRNPASKLQRGRSPSTAERPSPPATPPRKRRRFNEAAVLRLRRVGAPLITIRTPDYA